VSVGIMALLAVLALREAARRAALSRFLPAERAAWATQRRKPVIRTATVSGSARSAMVVEPRMSTKAIAPAA
jgi:hypothetical protein